VPLFDTYVAVDWSARSTPSPARPSPDAVWVGEWRSSTRDGRAAGGQETYWRTRHACLGYLQGCLRRAAAAGDRVLVGWDVAFGYPAGFAVALGLRGAAPPWRLVWNELCRLIADESTNRNNRFAVAATLNARCGGAEAGPLWGCPPGMEPPALRPTSPAFPYRVGADRSLPRLRVVDALEPRVQPIWKLYGHGSVGSQSLLGLPAVCRLRDDPALAAISQVWPLETGFTAPAPATDRPLIIHAEIWPGLVPVSLEARPAIRDQAQVRAVVTWLATLDHAGALDALLSPAVAMAQASAVEEEGWILGAGEAEPASIRPPRRR
jgi:hypothetical protein